MLRLMIVDDEPDICDFVQNFFQERNFEVVVAYNGTDALKLLEKERPHIVLLDLRIPAMDGMEVLKTIKKFDSNIKVVMITATLDADKAEQAKQLGASEYITKPLLLEQLERTILTISERVGRSGS